MFVRVCASTIDKRKQKQIQIGEREFEVYTARGSSVRPWRRFFYPGRPGGVGSEAVLLNELHVAVLLAGEVRRQKHGEPSDGGFGDGACHTHGGGRGLKERALQNVTRDFGPLALAILTGPRFGQQQVRRAHPLVEVVHESIYIFAPQYLCPHGKRGERGKAGKKGGNCVQMLHPVVAPVVGAGCLCVYICSV